MSTRAQLRARVRFYLDSKNSTISGRWSDDSINQALADASDYVTVAMISSGLSKPLVQTINVLMDGSGGIDLPGSSKVMSVFINYGPGLVVKIDAGERPDRQFITGLYSGNMSVDIIGENIFPDNDVDTVLYCGLDPQNKLVEQLVVLQAAADYKVIEGEANGPLLQLIAQRQTMLLNSPVSPGVSVVPLNSGFGRIWNMQAYPLKWYLDSATRIQVYAA